MFRLIGNQGYYQPEQQSPGLPPRNSVARLKLKYSMAPDSPLSTRTTLTAPISNASSMHSRSSSHSRSSVQSWDSQHHPQVQIDLISPGSSRTRLRKWKDDHQGSAKTATTNTNCGTPLTATNTSLRSMDRTMLNNNGILAHIAPPPITEPESSNNKTPHPKQHPVQSSSVATSPIKADSSWISNRTQFFTNPSTDNFSLLPSPRKVNRAIAPSPKNDSSFYSPPKEDPPATAVFTSSIKKQHTSPSRPSRKTESSWICGNHSENDNLKRIPSKAVGKSNVPTPSDPRSNGHDGHDQSSPCDGGRSQHLKTDFVPCSPLQQGPEKDSIFSNEDAGQRAENVNGCGDGQGGHPQYELSMSSKLGDSSIASMAVFDLIGGGQGNENTGRDSRCCGGQPITPLDRTNSARDGYSLSNSRRLHLVGNTNSNNKTLKNAKKRNGRGASARPASCSNVPFEESSISSMVAFFDHSTGGNTHPIAGCRRRHIQQSTHTEPLDFSDHMLDSQLFKNDSSIRRPIGEGSELSLGITSLVSTNQRRKQEAVPLDASRNRDKKYLPRGSRGGAIGEELHGLSEDSAIFSVEPDSLTRPPRNQHQRNSNLRQGGVGGVTSLTPGSAQSLIETKASKLSFAATAVSSLGNRRQPKQQKLEKPSDKPGLPIALVEGDPIPLIAAISATAADHKVSTLLENSISLMDLENSELLRQEQPSSQSPARLPLPTIIRESASTDATDAPVEDSISVFSLVKNTESFVRRGAVFGDSILSGAAADAAQVKAEEGFDGSDDEFICREGLKKSQAKVLSATIQGSHSTSAPNAPVQDSLSVLSLATNTESFERRGAAFGDSLLSDIAADAAQVQAEEEYDANDDSCPQRSSSDEVFHGERLAPSPNKVPYSANVGTIASEYDKAEDSIPLFSLINITEEDSHSHQNWDSATTWEPKSDRNNDLTAETATSPGRSRLGSKMSTGAKASVKVFDGDKPRSKRRSRRVSRRSKSEETDSDLRRSVVHLKSVTRLNDNSLSSAACFEASFSGRRGAISGASTLSAAAAAAAAQTKAEEGFDRSNGSDSSAIPGTGLNDNSLSSAACFEASFSERRGAISGASTLSAAAAAAQVKAGFDGSNGSDHSAIPDAVAAPNFNMEKYQKEKRRSRSPRKSAGRISSESKAFGDGMASADLVVDPLLERKYAKTIPGARGRARVSSGSKSYGESISSIASTSSRSERRGASVGGSMKFSAAIASAEAAAEERYVARDSSCLQLSSLPAKSEVELASQNQQVESKGQRERRKSSTRRLLSSTKVVVNAVLDEAAAKHTDGDRRAERRRSVKRSTGNRVRSSSVSDSISALLSMSDENGISIAAATAPSSDRGRASLGALTSAGVAAAAAQVEAEESRERRRNSSTSRLSSSTKAILSTVLDEAAAWKIEDEKGLEKEEGRIANRRSGVRSSFESNPFSAVSSLEGKKDRWVGRHRVSSLSIMSDENDISSTTLSASLSDRRGGFKGGSISAIAAYAAAQVKAEEQQVKTRYSSNRRMSFSSTKKTASSNEPAASMKRKGSMTQRWYSSTKNVLNLKVDKHQPKKRSSSKRSSNSGSEKKRNSSGSLSVSDLYLDQDKRRRSSACHRAHRQRLSGSMSTTADDNMDSVASFPLEDSTSTMTQADVDQHISLSNNPRRSSSSTSHPPRKPPQQRRSSNVSYLTSVFDIFQQQSDRQVRKSHIRSSLDRQSHDVGGGVND